jgi:fibronectin type 3 domain-containing protein
VIAGIDDEAIKIVWNKVDSAEGYRIYRDTAAYTGISALATVTDTSAYIEHQGKSCHIWVTSIKKGLESVPSNEVSWAPNQIVLYPPSNLQAVRTTDSTVQIYWNSVDSALSYLVLRNTGANLPDWDTIASTSDTFYVDRVVQNDLYYRVVAIHGSLFSEPTQSVGIIAPQDTTPLPPSITDCRILEPGSSINAKLVEVYTSDIHKGTICPQAGRFDNNTIEVVGKVEVLVR